MKKNKDKNKFLEQLRQIPVVQAAAEKSGLSRNTIYRWRKEDDKFRVEMDKAMEEGVDFVNDLSEVQLLTLIKNQDWRAVSFWLRLRNPKFKEKIEIGGAITTKQELSSEKKERIREALRRLKPMLPDVNSNYYEPNNQEYEKEEENE